MGTGQLTYPAPHFTHAITFTLDGNNVEQVGVETVAME
eukprot:gene41949-51995_t